MPIAAAQIVPGWVFRTNRNQHRVVLGFDAHGRVVYASRGGNVLNAFHNQRSTCSVESFAEKCTERLHQVDNLQALIEANSAGTVIVP